VLVRLQIVLVRQLYVAGRVSAGRQTIAQAQKATPPTPKPKMDVAVGQLSQGGCLLSFFTGQAVDPFKAK
jgi:hypothetical protein